MSASLGEHPLSSIDKDDGNIGGRCAGDHVAGVLLVTGRVGNDELSRLSREEPVSDVDRDSLLALSRQTIEQQRKVEVTTLRTNLARVCFQRLEVVVEHQVRVVQQPADQRALSVVDASAGNEPEHCFVLVRQEVALDVGSDEF